MNSKTILFPFIAVLAVFLIASVSALASGITTEFNGIELGVGSTIAGVADEVVPVRVTFQADDDAEDVRIRIWMDGYRDDVSDSSSRFNLVNGVTYTELLSLELPADLKNRTKDFVLHVSVSSAEDSDTVDYQVNVQREAYDFSILSVNYPTSVVAGDIIPISVVVENTGMQELENGFVKVSIPDLEISAKGYFGDLVSVEDDDGDKTDSLQKTVYLRLPENSEQGVYDITVKVYNSDTSTSVRELIKVDSSTLSVILAAAKTQTIKPGETKTYDLVIINSAESTKAYNIDTVSGNFLTVSAPSVITVGSDSSKTVPISVSVSSDANAGSYPFSVSVDNEQIMFEANVNSRQMVSGVTALTVILVIVFVVLLAVLIVLLTRKERPIEEVETSYY